MIEKIVQLCTSTGFLFGITVASDVAIAVSYFAIPITMAVVLRQRREDVPYPWLWTLFVTFIVACGLTHLSHVWTAFSGFENLELQATINLITAAASVGTALAFARILPQIRSLPSPKQQRMRLEDAVRERTSEKDALILEINHRIGTNCKFLLRCSG